MIDVWSTSGTQIDVLDHSAHDLQKMYWSQWHDWCLITVGWLKFDHSSMVMMFDHSRVIEVLIRVGWLMFDHSGMIVVWSQWDEWCLITVGWLIFDHTGMVDVWSPWDDWMFDHSSGDECLITVGWLMFDHSEMIDVWSKWGDWCLIKVRWLMFDQSGVIDVWSKWGDWCLIKVGWLMFDYNGLWYVDVVEVIGNSVYTTGNHMHNVTYINTIEIDLHKTGQHAKALKLNRIKIS